MRHNTIDRLETIARVRSDLGQESVPGRERSLTQRERLERWALALGRSGQSRLNTLRGTEHEEGEVRAQMRCDNSPISVALADPVLRANGLEADTYGDAKRFFDLSDWELHYIVCFCHYGGTMKAQIAANRVRQITRKAVRRASRAGARRIVLDHLRSFFGRRSAARAA